MIYDRKKEVKGAWIIHHGRKLVFDLNGAAEFPAIDEAAKTATILAKLGQANQIKIRKSEVRAIAKASGFNPRHELQGLLQVLESKRLIEQSAEEISVLGVTISSSLGHAADIYEDAQPSEYEQASLSLAEIASITPVLRRDVSEEIGDLHHLTHFQVNEFLDRAEEIGFVDKEGKGDDRLLFNGNLFRRNFVEKTQRVLSSLSRTEESLMKEVNEKLALNGCLRFGNVEKIVSEKLLEKLLAAGVYDVNEVTNERGEHLYITSPSAFHKFVDPMVDDCFDMAKSLVAALTYGMEDRSSSQGRITMLPILLTKLIEGKEIGPATAIGEDYRFLEVNRVVKLRSDRTYPERFYMRLVKREVGELAFHVLTRGDAHEQTFYLPGAPMTGYVGPEQSRMTIRRRQSTQSKRVTRDILEVIRGGQVH